MITYTNIQFCPACGSKNIESPSENSLHCKQCGYVLYHNTASATAVILIFKEKIVLVRRGHEPCKGMLDLPGGFIEYGESAEVGALREIKEETGFEVKNLKYFYSQPNTYTFKNVTYHTIDLCFTGEVESIDGFTPSEEVPELVCLNPDEIKIEEIAFVSLRKFVSDYVNKRKN